MLRSKEAHGTCCIFDISKAYRRGGLKCYSNVTTVCFSNVVNESKKFKKYRLFFHVNMESPLYVQNAHWLRILNAKGIFNIHIFRFTHFTEAYFNFLQAIVTCLVGVEFY